MIKQTLYFGNPAKLSVEHNQLKIHLSSTGESVEEGIFTRPLEDIGILIIDSPQIVVTSPVLQKILEYGAALIVCDQKHMPAGLMINMAGHTLQSERFKVQLNAKLPLKKRLWQQTVSAKIRNQGALLTQRFNEEFGNMEAWAKKVRSGDPENLEARAAAFYWKTILQPTQASNRDPEGAEPNAMLNYGYAILRAMMARALVASGMHPTLGIFHKNKYNPYCLADDIMEPYRPYVDRIVFDMLDINPDSTIENKETKRRLLSIPTSDVVIDGIRRPMLIGITETTASLFKCFSGEESRVHYPDMMA